MLEFLTDFLIEFLGGLCELLLEPPIKKMKLKYNRLKQSKKAAHPLA